MKPVYFISDLHLSAARPDISACFFDFLDGIKHEVEQLYILGDLFEVWLGDDDITPFSESIAKALKDLSLHCPVFFIHGNRDFAIRKNFAERAGMQILPEQYVFQFGTDRVLLMHGDELCTKDIAYQKFRRKARSWWWPAIMLALPLWLRKHIATRGRAISQNNQRQLTADIMDVTEQEVVNAMQAHQADVLIHGHTHRPKIHLVDLQDRQGTRLVLGDWYDQGSYLRYDETGFHLERLSFKTR